MKISLSQDDQQSLYSETVERRRIDEAQSIQTHPLRALWARNWTSISPTSLFFLQYHTSHINITIIIITIIFKMICDAPVVQVCTGIDVFCASRLNAAGTVPLLHSVNLCSNFHNCCGLSYFLKHFCTHHAWTQRVQCHRTIIIHAVKLYSNKA